MFSSFWLIFSIVFAIVVSIVMWNKTGVNMAPRFRILNFAVISASKEESGMVVLGLVRLGFRDQSESLMFFLTTTLTRVTKQQIIDAIKNIDTREFEQNVIDAAGDNQEKFDFLFSLFNRYETAVGDLSLKPIDECTCSLYGSHTEWSRSLCDVDEVSLGGKDSVMYISREW